MESFGEALRALRKEAGMRQVDLVEALDNVIARSTLANVEVSRERPSARLWNSLQDTFPQWISTLEPLFPTRTGPEDAFEPSGPFQTIEANYAYTFREHPSPEEIVQVRRVRATRDGAAEYGLKITSERTDFGLDSEPLFGGWIRRDEHHIDEDHSLYLTRFHFDRSLKAGEEHEFALRSWVAQADPGHSALVTFTLPTLYARITLNFLGARQPRSVWHFGPLADAKLVPTDGLGCPEVIPLAPGIYSIQLERPKTSLCYGMGWSW